MRECLYYFFRSRVVIILLIVIGSLGVIATAIWGGIQIFKKEEPKQYYNISGYFKDEEELIFVGGVQIKIGNELKATTAENGKFEIKYLEAGTVLTFEKENYIFSPSIIVVDRNISNIFIDSKSTIVDLTKHFNIKITDVNGLPLSDVNIIDKKVVGSTNYLGEFKISLSEGEKALSFRHPYYSVDSVNIKYDDIDLNKNLTANFDLNKYLYYEDSEGQPQTRTFTTGFTFRTKDGRLITNGMIYYKLKDESVFRYTTGYSIVFENKVFDTAFAYAYDSEKSTWICSNILKTSKIGGNIYLDEAIHISAKVDTSRGTVFTSSGYYFLADNDKNIELVIRSFEGESFYKELEYGIPKYELLLYDENNNLVTDVIHSVSNCVFKLK